MNAQMRRLATLAAVALLAAALGACGIRDREPGSGSLAQLPQPRPMPSCHGEGCLAVPVLILLETLISAGAQAAQGEARERERARLEPLATSGDAEAQIALGTMYYVCYGPQLCQHDPAKASEWFERAAARGNVEAMLRAAAVNGACDDDEACRHRHATAVTWLEAAAGAGSPEAQFALGRFHANRDVGRTFVPLRGVLLKLRLPTDHAKAAQWYRRAAEQDLAPAQLELGDMYAAGLGVAQDFGRARQWYERAAALRHKVAQYRLGELHENGRGTPPDEAEAYFWYLLSAQETVEYNHWLAPSQYSDAGEQRRRLERTRLTWGQVEAAKRRAKSWRRANPVPAAEAVMLGRR